MNKITKKTLYLLIPILVFGASAFFLVKSIEFISEGVTKMFSVDEARVDRNTVEVDLDSFTAVSHRVQDAQQEIDNQDVEEEVEESPVEGSDSEDSSPEDSSVDSEVEGEEAE